MLAPAIEEKQQVTECVGCGFCCNQSQCHESLRIFGIDETCPALFWHEERKRYVCGLYYLVEYREGLRSSLAIGEGCCSPHNEWRGDIRNRN